VPYTRGHERMRAKAEILDEVRQAVDSGRREIHLLGQIVNHYRAPDDRGCDFAQLLSEVNDVAGVERIRFASPHPRHTGARLVEAVRDLPKVCKHLHLPVQSGSTSVLAAMRRRYTREEYLDLVAGIRAAIPSASLSTDVIVGFPGETDADFGDTMTLLDLAQYSSVFSFKYSVRPNTLASKRMPDDVREEVKSERIVALQARQREIQLALHARAVGQVVHVLVDAVSRRRETELSGRTQGNTVVNFPIPSGSRQVNDWIGQTVAVAVRRGGAYSLWGEAVNADSGK
jgi:tRNA-2-methylthio-N6-dimethylallyladenosine synthase